MFLHVFVGVQYIKMIFHNVMYSWYYQVVIAELVSFKTTGYQSEHIWSLMIVLRCDLSSSDKNVLNEWAHAIHFQSRLCV